MKKFLTQIFIVVFFVVLAYAYFVVLDFDANVDKVFLSLSTFLFAIFTGFFISRQGKRYSDIRKLMADFDGTMSASYRAAGHLGDDVQAQVGDVIVAHYKPIVETGEWDYAFTHKTSTLTNLNLVFNKASKEKGTEGIKGTALTRILLGMHGAQLMRKNMVALREERVPGFQWLLIYAITAILFLAVSVMPSHGVFVGSIIKSAFISSILVVIVMLKRLDTLQLFEGTIGAHSAHDVIDIIEGKK